MIHTPFLAAVASPDKVTDDFSLMGKLTTMAEKGVMGSCLCWCYHIWTQAHAA